MVVIGLAGAIAACGAEMQPGAPANPPGPAARAPALGTIPPNGSRVTATVRQRVVWPPGSLAGTRPAVRPDRTWYSWTLDIVSAAPAAPTLENLARPGTVIDVFSSEPLAAELVGRTIAARVELTGTTQGTRWVISEITPNQ